MNNTVQFVGQACGHHGSYTFYKGLRYCWKGVSRILALGEFFFVKLWPDEDIISIGELQLMWEDKATGHILVSLRLYFLPENTPEGRTEEHGEDEVVSISDKVVLRAVDMLTWLLDDVSWDRGQRRGFAWGNGPENAEPTCTMEDPCAGEAGLGLMGQLDMRDVLKEKQLLGGSEPDPISSKVLVLSYSNYCRYRAALRRFEGCNPNLWARGVLQALGAVFLPSRATPVLFCKNTFDYPELEDHPLLCNHLAPKWKGRPRRKRKKRSPSPSSESNESESSASTARSSIKSKDAPNKSNCKTELHPPVANVKSRKHLYRAFNEHTFLQSLHAFMQDRGTPIERVPSLGFKQLDLFGFFQKVQDMGGYDAAVAYKLWKRIYVELGGQPSNTSAATCTRRHYERLLLPYERHRAGLMEEETEDGVSPPKRPHLVAASNEVPKLELNGNDSGKVLHKQEREEAEHEPARRRSCEDRNSAAQDQGSEAPKVKATAAASRPATPDKCPSSEPPETPCPPPSSLAPPPQVAEENSQASDDVIVLEQEEDETKPTLPSPSVNNGTLKLVPKHLLLEPSCVEVKETPPATTAQNLTLHELMAGTDSVTATPTSTRSALHDLARIANQIQGSSNAAAPPPWPISSSELQVTVIPAPPVKAERASPCRPSVIQKVNSNPNGSTTPPLKPNPAHQNTKSLNAAFLALAPVPLPAFHTPSMYSTRDRVYGDPTLDTKRPPTAPGKATPTHPLQTPSPKPSALTTTPKQYLATNLNTTATKLSSTGAVNTLLSATPTSSLPAKPPHYAHNSTSPVTANPNARSMISLAVSSLISPTTPSITPAKMTSPDKPAHHPSPALEPGFCNGSGTSSSTTNGHYSNDEVVVLNVVPSSKNGSIRAPATNSDAIKKANTSPATKFTSWSPIQLPPRSKPTFHLPNDVSISVKTDLLSSAVHNGATSTTTTAASPRPSISVLPVVKESPLHPLSGSKDKPLRPPSRSRTAAETNPAPPMSSSASLGNYPPLFYPPIMTLKPSAPSTTPSGVDPAYYPYYAPHVYGLPPPFLASVMGNSAVEATAQAYKELVQRGYPPALAPNLGLIGSMYPGLLKEEQPPPFPKS